jgi:hypothetical protein
MEALFSLPLQQKIMKDSRKRTELKNEKGKCAQIKTKLKCLTDDDIISRKLILKSVFPERNNRSQNRA